MPERSSVQFIGGLRFGWQQAYIYVCTHNHTCIYIYIYIYIFWPKRDEVTREWRELHNEELTDLYCSLNIVQVINREE
jgi:hypothetical protein